MTPSRLEKRLTPQPVSWLPLARKSGAHPGRNRHQKPLLAFAVCYVAAHLALGLVDEAQAEAILNHCEELLEG
jgi:hypothetical protein